ncbi:MAG: hypothetical protein UX85_C0009G0018 [Candidatus Beckwithbacteria bacterium GW2011_GWB1_47_15]|uniref:Uncharacterized protein n=2 Tax=Patescibacteria group TaxID=1783273 RepID=A0A1G2LWE9_9BACT|nr:MAG: hypothetical protein UW18_C0003G0018 [Microgenomates group bacterium GW2011_GWF1_44_10]KKU02441.1 MAG: hypothetical protein UX04_C0001G0212 [Microgenomates group bacterium GW2011_GWF2_45_18]KKU60565.1 MAG: hypothetical protein UX85_C0009G0018 [Candidatus Beckwithbacteria bacterium GW2011_GWB1_47_15]KKU71335.1 MAG: hypothetical protein UX97_C0008G0018 [Candidatus Beckwithbacteria bacterium GW2011_GWA2_47_25]OHA15189.1 MAG: hypothetical protein A3A10_02945 [Candidatus Tagabacteria bacteri
MRSKEIAKFFSGLTAWEAVVHLALGLSGVLPLTLFGFTLTPTINTVQIIIPATVSILLGYYAWSKK